jgi:hypothetical protein
MKIQLLPALLISVFIAIVIYSFSINQDYYKQPVQAEIPYYLLKPGDIIFRDGIGIVSDALKKFSLTDKRYSHAGIIHIENNKVFVYHMMTGGKHSQGGMIKEPIENFCNPTVAASFAFYRTTLNGNRMDSLAGVYFTSGVKFDTDFDLNTTDRLYCTELIYCLIKKLSPAGNFITLSEAGNKKFVACDNLYLNRNFHLIYSSFQSAQTP